jgi:hypothetical protein
VVKLAEAIQHIQVRIMELEIQAVLSLSQEVCNQRQEASKRVVGRIRDLTLE